MVENYAEDNGNGQPYKRSLVATDKGNNKPIYSRDYQKDENTASELRTTASNSNCNRQQQHVQQT
jgi:hypothetical protein